MSTTTTPPVAVNPIVTEALTSIPALVGMLLGGKLASLNVSIQGELNTIETDAGAELTKLQAALDAAETSNPLVGQSIAAVTKTVEALGIALPTEAALFAGLHAVVNDLVMALKPAATA